MIIRGNAMGMSLALLASISLASFLLRIGYSISKSERSSRVSQSQTSPPSLISVKIPPFSNDRHFIHPQKPKNQKYHVPSYFQPKERTILEIHCIASG